MAQNIQKGIIGVLALLMGFGGSLLLTLDQIENAYICTANEKIGFFDSFSSTMKTGYWSDDSGDHSSVCRGGYWVKLADYAKEKGVDPSVFLYHENPEEIPEEIPDETQSAIKYRCDFKECTRIN